MKRIILAMASACVALTAVYNNVAIAHFYQSKNPKTNSESSKWVNLQPDYRQTYFNLGENPYFLDTARHQIGSNAWFMNGLNRIEIERRLARQNPHHQQHRARFSRAQETTAINLDSHDLSQPHNLVITADRGTEITGQITLDGRIIQTIKGNRTAIDLSNRLSRGRHLIEVFGNYRPASSSVQVEFSAPGTRVSQATGGSGAVRQTLILDVR